MNKKISIALYIAYSIALVLVITFGSSASKLITNPTKDAIQKSEIDDVIADKWGGEDEISQIKTKNSIYDLIDLITAKVLGHMVIFAVLAALTLNMFRHLNIGNKYVKLTLYFASAFPTAIITEFVQTFIPNRHGKVTDVLIDFLGFLFGTALTVLIVYLCKRMKAKKAAIPESETAQDTQVSDSE